MFSVRDENLVKFFLAHIELLTPRLPRKNKFWSGYFDCTVNFLNLNFLLTLLFSSLWQILKHFLTILKFILLLSNLWIYWNLEYYWNFVSIFGIPFRLLLKFRFDYHPKYDQRQFILWLRNNNSEIKLDFLVLAECKIL